MHEKTLLIVIKYLKTILTECRSDNHLLDFALVRWTCIIKTRTRSRSRTSFWRSLFLGWKEAPRHSPQGVNRNILSTDVPRTDQNQCSYPHYNLLCYKFWNLTNHESDFKIQAHEKRRISRAPHLVNLKQKGPSPLAKLLVWLILARLSSFA